MLVAGHMRAQQRTGPELIMARNSWGLIEGDRRPQIERRPVAQQVGRDILPYLLEAGGPT